MDVILFKALEFMGKHLWIEKIPLKRTFRTKRILSKLSQFFIKYIFSASCYKNLSPKEEIIILNKISKLKKYEDVIENRPPNGILRNGEVGQRLPQCGPYGLGS